MDLRIVKIQTVGHKDLPQAVSVRCIWWWVGADCPLPDAAARGRGTAGTQPPRGVQWAAVHREDRRAVAVDAERPATLGGSVSADATLAGGRLLRNAGGWSARRAAAGGGTPGRTHRRDHRQPDIALHAW